MRTLAVVWLSFQFAGGGELVVRQDKITAVLEQRYGTTLPQIAIGHKDKPEFFVCIEGLQSCLSIQWDSGMATLREKVSGKPAKTP